MSPLVWFALDDDAKKPTEYAFSELSFLHRLREAAADWPYGPSRSWAGCVQFGDPDFVAVISLSDIEKRVSLADFGVVLFPSGDVRGDKLHNQSYELPDQPSDLAMAASGTLEQVVAVCAAWFAGILGKPIDRYEWWHRGKIYARRWLFADTGQLLVESTVARRVIRVHGLRAHGLRARGLGAPDKIIRVSGEAPGFV